MTDAYLDAAYRNCDPPRVSDYPRFLCEYLLDRGEYILSTGVTSMADLGAGIGAFTRPFRDAGIKCVTVDWTHESPLPDVDHYYAPSVVGLHRPCDLVLCKSVLEHIPDHTEVMEVANFLTRDGGMLCLIVPDWRYWRDVFYDDPTHVHPMDLNALKLVAKMYGFEVVEAKLIHQHSGLDGTLWQRIAAWVYSRFVTQRFAYWLGEKTGLQWLRYAKLKSAMVIARKVKDV